MLSTKVGRLLVPNEPSDLTWPTASTPPTTCAGARLLGHWRAPGLEESLERLGLDRIDMALVHDPDDHVGQVVAEALPELVRMRDEGIVRAIGVRG